MSAQYDLDLMKRQIEAQMADYERETIEFSRFMDVWRERQKIGRHEFVDYETGEVRATETEA